MSRTEYMKQLAYLLQDVPDNEKEEALSWYEDYFELKATEEQHTQGNIYKWSAQFSPPRTGL